MYIIYNSVCMWLYVQICLAYLPPFQEQQIKFDFFV